MGPLLQAWRRQRGKSQLALALEAGVSARHLSFIESGRARPSREMVMLLGECLEVPIRERNTLLTAAGFAAAYREEAIGAPALAPVRRAIDLILARQEPWPAVVMDRSWNLLEANQGARRLFARLLEGREVPGPPNVLRTLFHPEGVRRYVANWNAVAGALIRRVYRESIGGSPDQPTAALLAEIVDLAGIPLRTLLTSAVLPDSALFPVSFRHGDLELDFFSTLTTLGTPRDATLQEIRIESFFPATSRTEAVAGQYLGPDERPRE